MRYRIFLTVLFLWLLVFSGPTPPAAQEGPGGAEESLPLLLEEARDAMKQEFYPRALELLTRAEKAYPREAVIPRMTGELYHRQKLYNLALEALVRADALEPDDLDTLTLLADTQGRLNRNRESARTLERILERYPDSPETAADLGWMYFKTFRPAEGVALLQKALETSGDSPGLLMTLGTLYTSLYDYPRAREYYLRSISAADEIGWDFFSSVAYYNLALLDLSFYRYPEAMEDARKSVEINPRFSGYISLGELSLARMDFQPALEAYTSAYNQDETPLTLVSLADLYLHFGFLDAALAHLDEARNFQDSSWMYFFGVDPDRHLMDIHELYGDLYRALSVREFRRPAAGWERVKALFRGVRYRIKGWIHRKTFQQYCVRVGKSFREEGNRFDGDLLYFQALKDYPRSALRYLRRSEEFEREVAPESYRHYLYQEGALLKDTDLLLEALEALDPEWEKEIIDQTLKALIPLLKEDERSREVRNLLYGINPGAFVGEPFSLPVQLEGDTDRRLRRYLRRGGLEPAGSGAVYALRLRREETGVYVSFRNLRENRVLWTEKFTPSGEGPLSREELTEKILAAVFTVR